MKIGIDIRELERGKQTGIGRFLRTFLAHACPARPEHTFFLYGNQHTQYEPATANAVLRRRAEGATWWWDQVALPAMAHQDGVDLFFSPYMKGPLRVRCPLVITIHDLIFLAFPAYGGARRPAHWLLAHLARRVGARAQRVLTDSAHAAGDIERFLGIERTKVQVLPLGVEAHYRPGGEGEDLEAVCGRYRIARPYVLYVGNFKPHKNVVALLRAFAGLPPALRQGHALVLAGGGEPGRGRLERLAGELGVGERVRFTGPVAEEDLPTLYRGAALFAFPSLYEGFGLPPLEAMACGAPLLCSNRTSLPEVVGEAGWLVDPEDGEAWGLALQRLLEDGAERRRLRALGLERAALFGSGALCERQMQVLEEAAGGGWR